MLCSVHGDDVTTAGPKIAIDWSGKEMELNYELIKGGRLGPGAEDDHEGRILNRVVRYTKHGIEYEADPRQGERLLVDLGLDGAGVKGTATPGVKVLAHQASEEKELDKDQHTKFRAAAARAIYLAADRPDRQ